MALNALAPTTDINTYIAKANEQIAKYGSQKLNPDVFYSLQLLDTIRLDQKEYVYFRYVDNGRMLTALTEVYTNPQYTDLLKQSMPEFKPQDILDVFSQITLTDLTINFLLVNSFLAIVLSLPTAFVARLKK